MNIKLKDRIYKMRLFNNKGFSLVELAVVLAIIGIVMVGTMQGMGVFRSTENLEKVESRMLDLKEQLLRFAKVHKYLPCPDQFSSSDGLEDRALVGVIGLTCLDAVGTLPYIDLGLTRDDVEDEWGNLIRYAVNQNVTQTASICDETSSASYFCNSGVNGSPAAIFNLVDTPPLSGFPGPGNYLVCNENAASGACFGTVDTNLLSTDSASVVLVAYNEDASICATATGDSNAENCDENEYYHQATISPSPVFFDDKIITITGYEIKAQILSAVTYWDDTSVNSPLEASYEGYDLTVDNGYTPSNDANDPDVILVNRNVTTALDLAAGDDYVVVGNDLSSDLDYDFKTGVIASDSGANAVLNAGEGDDTIYIVNNADSDVFLGDGNDTFVLGKDLTQSLSADLGDDSIWIQGNIDSGSTLTLGAGDDTLWLGSDDIVWLKKVDDSGTAYSLPNQSGVLNAQVDGGAGYDVVVMENLTKSDWLDAPTESYLPGFEIILFSDHSESTPNYCILPGCLQLSDL